MPNLECKQTVERHRKIFPFIASIYPFLNGGEKKKKILHFAPEQIFKDIFIKSGAEYYDVDILPGRAKYTEDITNLSFGANEFNYIFCIHVLEHIVEDLKAMHELYRVLVPGGVAFLCGPFYQDYFEKPEVTDPAEREKLYGQNDHVRKYSLDIFCERLNSAGFNTNQILRANSFIQFPGLKDSMLNPEIFVFARKPYNK